MVRLRGLFQNFGHASPSILSPSFPTGPSKIFVSAVDRTDDRVLKRHLDTIATTWYSLKQNIVVTVTKRKSKSKTIQWIKLRNSNVIEINKQGNSPSSRSVRFPKIQILVEMFRRHWQHLQSPVWKRHGDYLRDAPTWRPENSVNTWNLWLCRRLIISTEQTSIYISIFPNNLL